MMNPKNSNGGHRAPQGIMPKVIIGFIWLFICVWFSNQSGVKLSNQIGELEKERDMQKVRSKKIEVTMTSMLGGELLTNTAVKRYGFKMPSNGQVIIVGKKEEMFGGLNRIFNSAPKKENDL
jgi:hypothetical protein